MKHSIALLAVVLLLISGCSAKTEPLTGKYDKYTYEFFGTFNTMIQFMGYAENEKQFEELALKGQSRFEELHKLYDIYNSYEGINNIKTINDNAGIEPLEVKQEIIDMLMLAKAWHDKTDGKVNIALGPVLSIWHSYREEGKSNPLDAKIPEIELLKKAALKTDITKLEIDNSNKTVFLREAGMSLDVGAVAKGFATEIVARELSEAGFSSFVISAGGNVRVVGQPQDGIRSKWGIGIQDPDKNTLIPDTTPLDIVFMTDASLVASGDYERYYEVNGQRFHHIIDPTTLKPANYYRAVTILTENSAIADILSTAAFLLPYDKSKVFIESIPGVNAYWVFPNGSTTATDNMKDSLMNMGGASSK
ncbi:MAG: FAD:protein FMN transferase [Clostridia bacterium]